MKTMRLAVPTMGPGGLEAERADHFGHCDCFTLVDLEEGKIKDITVIDNPPHAEGGCLRPVKLLAGHKVNAIVAVGMGMRPLMGFNQEGITVFFDNLTLKVSDLVRLAAEEKLPVMTTNEACNHHH